MPSLEFVARPQQPSPTPSKDAAARLIGALGLLIPAGTFRASRAAAHLICVEVIKNDPLPAPGVVDAEACA